MSDEIKPCPWCGNTVLRLGGEKLCWWMECHACWSTGPTHSSGDEAIAAWNTRATDAEVERLRAENERLKKFERDRWEHNPFIQADEARRKEARRLLNEEEEKRAQARVRRMEIDREIE